MRFLPYLNFGGNCREAFTEYERIFGGELEIMTHGDSPIAGEVPSEWHGSVLHACLKIGDTMLMASDSPGSFEAPRGVWVSIHVETPAEAERIYQSLSRGGTVVMPLEKTFWAERFAMFTDRFGIPWMINCAPAAPPVG